MGQDLIYPFVTVVMFLTLAFSTASAVVASLKNRNEIAWMSLGIFWIPFLLLLSLPKLSKNPVAPIDDDSIPRVRRSTGGNLKTKIIAYALLTIIWASVFYGYYTVPDMQFDVQTAWSCLWDLKNRRTQLIRFGHNKNFNIRFEYYDPNFNSYKEWVNQLKFQSLLEKTFSDPVDGRRMWVVQRLSDHYRVLLAVKKGLHLDPESIANQKRLAVNFSQSAFDGIPVDIHMCDLFLNTLRVVPMPSK